MKKFSILLILFLSTFQIWAAFLKNLPTTVFQPNGERIECFTSGDEYFNYLHDKNGYTIIQASDGYYYYAIKSNDQLIPSEYKVNEIDPVTTGIEPYALISKKAYYEKVNKRMQNVMKRDAPTTGVINNLNIFIRFSDEEEFEKPRSEFDIIYSDTSSYSLKHYYNEVSYNTLEIDTWHYPVTTNDICLSYQDDHPRAYYQPYNAVTNPIGYQDNEAGEREHSLLKNAVEYVESEIPEELNIDADGDGYVDNVGFMVYGQVGNWADLLWPHRWSLYSYNVSIHGKTVFDYMFLLDDDRYNDVGTLCHEFFHVLGAPDLYHYWDDEAPTPVGGWDIMEGSSLYPPHMCGFMKYKYGNWIPELTEITESGDYSLKPLTNSEHNIFKIASPYSYSEYFVIDYRKKEGMYESYTPGTSSGIVVYRINTNAGIGNAGGPPDEVYVYRVGGYLNETGQLNKAMLSIDAGRTEINDYTDPFSYLYNYGEGGIGGLNISEIGVAGDSINFHVEILKLVPPSFLSFVPGDNSIDLAWKTPLTGNPEYYNVYRDSVVIATTSTNSFTDTDVVNAIQYSYKVTAVYSGSTSGESDATNSINVAPIPPLTLPYSIDFESGNESWMFTNMEYNWEIATNDEINLLWLDDNESTFAGINSTSAGYYTHVTGVAISPVFNLAEYQYVNISFDYALKSWNNFDRLILKYRIGPNYPFQELFELEPSTSWRHISIDVPSTILRDGMQFGLYYDDSNEFAYGAAFDNFTVTEEAELTIPDFEADLTELCENTLITYTNLSTGTNHEYFWDFGEGAQPATATTEGPHEVLYPAKGQKTVKLTIDNTRNEFKFNYLNVNYVPKARINFGIDNNLISFSTPTIADRYLWELGDGTTSLEQSFTHSYAETGNYTVKLQVENECGIDIDSVILSITVTNIEEHSPDLLFDIYPNPNKGIFTINVPVNEEIEYVQVFNLQGDLIYSNLGDANVVKLSKVDKGIYILSVKTSNKLRYKKLVIN